MDGSVKESVVVKEIKMNWHTIFVFTLLVTATCAYRDLWKKGKERGRERERHTDDISENWYPEQRRGSLYRACETGTT